jgi:hypothetical protein
MTHSDLIDWVSVSLSFMIIDLKKGAKEIYCQIYKPCPTIGLAATL